MPPRLPVPYRCHRRVVLGSCKLRAFVAARRRQMEAAERLAGEIGSHQQLYPAGLRHLPHHGVSVGAGGSGAGTRGRGTGGGTWRPSSGRLSYSLDLDAEVRSSVHPWSSTRPRAVSSVSTKTLQRYRRQRPRVPLPCLSRRRQASGVLRGCAAAVRRAAQRDRVVHAAAAFSACQRRGHPTSMISDGSRRAHGSRASRSTRPRGSWRTALRTVARDAAGDPEAARSPVA